MVVLFLIDTDVISQNRVIDSLQAINNEVGKERFDVTFELCRQHVLINDNETALNYANQALEISLENGDSLSIVMSSRMKGAVLRRLERFEESIIIATKTLTIAVRRNYRDEIKYLLNTLALANTNVANYDKALEYNFQSLVIRENEGDKSEISITLMNIGVVYFKLRNYDKAIDYFHRSLDLKKEIADNYDMDRLLINIGISNIHLKNFEAGLKFINEGFGICGKNCTSEIRIEGEFGLGVSYYNLKEFEISEKHFEQSLQISKDFESKRFQAENLVYLSRIALKKDDLPRASKLLTEAESIAKQSKYNQLLIDTYKEFSTLYTQTKDFQSASNYQHKYIKLKDSLIGEELVKNVSRIQTNFEERENRNTIRLTEEALARQRNLNIAVGIIAVLAGLLGFVLYRGYTTTRKVNTQLSEAKSVITVQNLRLQNINRELDGKVKEKTAELVTANDDLAQVNTELEKVNVKLKDVIDELDNFIYKTSHDIRGPLASLKGICSVALMDVQDPLALDYLAKLDVSSGRLNVILTRLLIVNQINHAILNIEKIEFNPIVEEILLLERKKGLPERIKIRQDIDSNLMFHSDRDIFKIILENLIDNAIKFYNDSERIQSFVSIRIAAHGTKELMVSVIDNGIGVAEAKPDKIFQMFSRASERSGTGGIGLYLCKLATEKLGGEINLRTTPEGHTEFYAYYPLKLILKPLPTEQEPVTS